MSVGKKRYGIVDVPVLRRIGQLPQRQRGGALAVYVALAVHADDETGECWPGMATIADLANVDVRSAKRIMPVLVAVGLVAITERRKESGEHDSNSYFLPYRVGGDADDTTQAVRGGRRRHQGSDADVQEVVTPTSPKQTNEQTNEQTKKREPDSDEPEDDFRLQGTPKTKPQDSAFTDFIAKWNAIEGIRPCRVTDRRTKTFNARSKDRYWRDTLPEALRRISSSSFLRGENDRGWKANIDWFLRADTLTNIMEGKYDDRATTPGTSQGGRSVGGVRPESPARHRERDYSGIEILGADPDEAAASPDR